MPGSARRKSRRTWRSIFPKAVVRRMDADSMTRKEAYRETLRDFRAGKIDILVGTQMIAKGLHFPNVTLVGIINADLALHLPDFRAGERTFQIAHPGGWTRRARRNAGRSFRANLHAVQPVHSICAASRFRRLFSAGTRIPRALRFPAVQARDPDHRALRARELAHNCPPKLLTRRLKEALPEEFILGDANTRAARKIAGAISFSHSDPRRSNHAPEPPRPRDAR